MKKGNKRSQPGKGDNLAVTMLNELKLPGMIKVLEQACAGFLQDLEALLRYFQFENWDEVLAFLFNGLELDTG